MKEGRFQIPEEAPSELQIKYVRHADTDLLCAYSEDLPGLNAFGRSLREVNEELAELCSAFVAKLYGVNLRYRFVEEDIPEPSGFVPVEDARLELEPA